LEADVNVLQILALANEALTLCFKLKELAKANGATDAELDAIDMKLTEIIERRKGQA
jgi:hypothetical protein